MGEEYEGLTVAEALAAERSEERISEAEEVIDETADVSGLADVREALDAPEGVDPIAAMLAAPDSPPTKPVYIRRLDAYFTVSAITDDKVYDKLVDRCTSYVRNRRGGGRNREVDGRRLSKLTVAEFTLKPGFKPGRPGFEELAAKHGTKESDALVGKSLMLGEIDLLADEIMTLSGFEDEVENAGN